MRFITSLLFWIFINAWGAIIPILYFPAFIFRSSKLADHGAFVWSKVGLWVLKILCGVDCKIIGLEKLPNKPVIVACKHQSMWETIVMHLVFHRPAYAFKKELLKIPFYGWYIKIMSGIKVDRQGGASALKDLIKQTKKYLEEGHSIIIFPQGTRVPINKKTDEYPYQAGIAAMYLSAKATVVPAALNSGVYWKKNNMIKKAGTITLEFLDPIEPGLKKAEFLEKLEEVVEKRSEELAKK